MKNKIRLIAAALAAAVIITTFASCQSQSGGTVTVSEDLSDTTEASAAEPEVDYSAILSLEYVICDNRYYFTVKKANEKRRILRALPRITVLRPANTALYAPTRCVSTWRATTANTLILFLTRAFRIITLFTQCVRMLKRWYSPSANSTCRTIPLKSSTRPNQKREGGRRCRVPFA